MKTVSLEKLSEDKGMYGGTFSAVNYYEGAPRYVRITDIDSNGDLNDKLKAPSGVKEDWKKYYLKENDLLFARSGSVGKTFLYREKYGECVFAGYLIKFQINTDVALPKYVYYYTLSDMYNLWIEYKQRVVSIPNINAKQYGHELKIPLPPLETQKRIARILDQADALRRKNAELLDYYDKLVQSVFLEMFGHIGKNEKKWKIVPVIEKATATVPKRDKPKSFTGNIPWIKTQDLEHLGFTGKSKKGIGLTVNEVKEVRRSIIKKGSVVMTCVGDLGVVSILSKDSVMNQQLHAFHCSDELNNIFLMYCLSHQKEFMLKKASTTTVPYMNKTVCNSIPIMLPPIELQNKFAQIADNIEAQKSKLKASIQESENLFQCLLQKAFKGEL